MAKKSNKLSESSPEQRPGEVTHVAGMYQNWFLDYASYVILERAVPDIRDGLKPVQRRILHAMREMDDGRFHKVANIIGQTMQFHPHGDAAIGDALVNLGQKDLLIDTQGNWGDLRTGDDAAAPRYIEARLSQFALEVAFNKDTTEWQLSYDGRKSEPVFLPIKFPLVLAQGVEGIAVGLSTKILPHNFCELILASIQLLKGEEIELYPDFPTGGMVDVSDYNQGERGGKVRVRARMIAPDKKTILIKDIPYGTTTTSVIDSIIRANDKGKIKIKKVVDNTAQEVEIAIEIAPGVSPDVTMDALYAFTDCEISISPINCVIREEKPVFLTVGELLKESTRHTKQLLKRELEIELADLEDKWHFSSLEKIFIENKIYRDIEECETWEAVILAIDNGLEPHKHKLMREVSRDDIVRLTEIKIKRISRFDSFKADEYIRQLEKDMKRVKHDLRHLTEYAIAYFENLLNKYGKGRERKTEIRKFDTIEAKSVVANNAKLYVNREEGFIGFGLKKDEFVCECSDIDDIIAFTEDGVMKVVRIAEKVFIGKKILYVSVWKKDDERKTYHLVYSDAKAGKAFAKRFNVTSITRDKEYNMCGGAQKAKVWYLNANPNGESEIVQVQLHPNARAHNKLFEFDFGSLGIKGRDSKGIILTKYPLKKITQKEIGTSTIGGRNIWFDTATGRLNTESRGRNLGEFDTGDLLLALYRDGTCELTDTELSNRYDIAELLHLVKYDPETIITAVYWDAESGNTFIKRFYIEHTATGKKYAFTGENKDNRLLILSIDPQPVIELTVLKGRKKEPATEIVQASTFIDIKGWKSQGNRLSSFEIQRVKLLTSSSQAEEPVTSDANTVTRKEKSQTKKKVDKPDGEKQSEPEQLHIGSKIEWDVQSGNKKVKGSGRQGKLFE